MALLFHDDDDLIAVRSEIFNYGETDFEDQMQESEDMVIRALDARWYRSNAENFSLDWREDPFQTDLMLDVTEVKRVCVYKSLQLIYLLLAKEMAEPDGFERNSATFKKLYAEEMNEVLTAGISYDWDESGDETYDETKIPAVRRLYRV
jgi:hypothetical protein